MSEYRDRLPTLQDQAEAAALVSRLLNESTVPLVGARLSTVATRNEDGGGTLVAARLEFSDTVIEERQEHLYPSFTLTDRWLTCDQALALLGSLSSGDELPTRIKGQPGAERVLTTYGIFRALPQASVLVSYDLSEQRTPENLPAVAFGLPPFTSWTAAALWWFGENGQDIRGKHYLIVVVPDLNAIIESAQIIKAELHVQLVLRDQTRAWELHYILGEDERPVARGRIAVVDEVVVLPAANQLRKAELWLVASGSRLPSVHRAFWNLRDEDADQDDTEVAKHQDTILQGESDLVELKPFIGDDGHKLAEFAESVTAFANSRGGAVYIGVTDDCVIQGLRKLEGVHKGDKREARTGLLQRLREVLGRIHPVPLYTSRWIELPAGPVLVIEVAPSTEVHAFDTSHVFVRRGSSDRHATRAELEEMFKGRGVGPSNTYVPHEDIQW